MRACVCMFTLFLVRAAHHIAVEFEILLVSPIFCLFRAIVMVCCQCSIVCSFPFSRSLGYENSAVVYRKPHGLLCLLKGENGSAYRRIRHGLCYRWLNVRRCSTIYCRWPFFIAYVADDCNSMRARIACLCARCMTCECECAHDTRILRRYRTRCPFRLHVCFVCYSGSVFIFHFYVLVALFSSSMRCIGVDSTAARHCVTVVLQ